MAGNWEIFVRLHLDQLVGIVLHTPLYNLITANFPIQFIAKLISTVRYSSADYTTIISAAAIIQDVAGTRVFRQTLNSPTTTFETLAFLRRNAIYFMLNGLGIIAVQECGKVLASKLLRSALEIDVAWGGFLQLARRGFFLAQYALQSSILDIIYDQPQEVARRFMSFLEPSIRENYALFPPIMINLLGAGNDHRPYRILADVCGLVTVTQWSILMEAAIMSAFFDGAHSSWSRVSAAISLRFCIDNGPEIHYHHHMICKLHAIIYYLRRSREHLERLVAVELYEAYARRILNAPILRRRR